MVSNRLFHRFRCLLFWLIAPLLAVSLATLPAAAQTQPSPQDKETARNLMDHGLDKFDQGDFAGALKEFVGADDIVRVTSTGLWIGKTLVRLGRLIEAREKLLAVSRIPPAKDESLILANARTEAEQLQRGLAERIPELKLEVKGVPEGAEVVVRIDGAAVPQDTFAYPRKLDPGSHTIEATSAGFYDLKLTVSIRETERQTVPLLFESNGLPVEAPVEPDGDEAGMSPLVWIGFGVGAAALVIGSVTGGLSLSAASDAKEGCVDQACPLDNEPDADRSLTFAHVSTVSFAVAGAGIAVGVIGLLMGSDSDDEAAIEPQVGIGYGGLSGRF